MKITVDRERCRGHNNCVSIAPNVFDLDETFKAIVIDPKGDTEDTILKAARMCPKLAILLDDEKTGARLFPGPGDRTRDQLDISK
ncbi:MAG TPA: ferredoxin [candidate division Zixibacteria bacterium]|nr:ferredoxin [candidate division Zixibacteria bacterium]